MSEEVSLNTVGTDLLELNGKELPEEKETNQ